MECKECGQSCNEVCTCGIPICINCELKHFGFTDQDVEGWIKEIKQLERENDNK